MRRGLPSHATAVTLLATLLGCGAPTNNTGGAPTDAGASDAASSGGGSGSIACVNTTCSGAGRNICCVELAFTPPFLSGVCAGDPARCTQTALSCDDATDCPSAQRCCVYQLGINGMMHTFSSCKPACGGLTNEREMCDRSGAGRCANDGFCCRQSGDLFGVCVTGAAMCVPDAGP